MTGTSPLCFIGIDIGTSGCRAVAIDDGGQLLACGRVPLPPAQRAGRCHHQDPAIWWRAIRDGLLPGLLDELTEHAPRAIAVDATSATVLLCDDDAEPLTSALLYDSQASPSAVARIASVAPAESPARAPTSSLAKLLDLEAGPAPHGPHFVLHQADWIVARLTGQVGHSDLNNALKLGCDPVRGAWPAWVRELVGPDCLLPRVHRPGTVVAPLSSACHRLFGLDEAEPIEIVAGTTDSIAAFIATGASMPGDAVTSLGTTLVLKIVSGRRIESNRHGVYSHAFDDHWLAGGASNCGGAILARYFSPEEIASLSSRIDPATDSGLDYYPLCRPGERFPHADPALEPRLSPRPASNREFLHGLLEGLARVEAAGYERLHELGAPRPRRILSTGTGAGNACWRRLRERILGIPVVTAAHTEAAYGAALLARRAIYAQTKETIR